MREDRAIQRKKEFRDRQTRLNSDHLESIKSYNGDKSQLQALLNHYQSFSKDTLIKQVIKTDKTLSWLKSINEKSVLQTYLAAKLLLHHGMIEQKLEDLISEEEVSMKSYIKTKKDSPEKSPIDIYHEKVKSYISDLELSLDDYITGKDFDFNQYVIEHTLKPRTIKLIQNHFKKNHYDDTIENSDGYRSKILKKVQKFYSILTGIELRKLKPKKEPKEKKVKPVQKSTFIPCKQLWMVDKNNCIVQIIAQEGKLLELDRKTLKNVKSSVKKRPKTKYLHGTINKIKKCAEVDLITFMTKIDTKERNSGNRYIESEYKIIRRIE